MEDPCALQLTLYYDDLEVCNPLGSKAKIHKLGTYYISTSCWEILIPNFAPPFTQSNLLLCFELNLWNSIQLVKYWNPSDYVKKLVSISNVFTLNCCTDEGA